MGQLGAKHKACHIVLFPRNGLQRLRVLARELLFLSYAKIRRIGKMNFRLFIERYIMADRKITVLFRWPVNQTSDNSVEVVIPQGNEIINSKTADHLRLTDAEYMRAEDAAIRTLLVVN
jgi:hypothetical protein